MRTSSLLRSGRRGVTERSACNPGHSCHAAVVSRCLQRRTVVSLTPMRRATSRCDIPCASSSSAVVRRSVVAGATAKSATGSSWVVDDVAFAVSRVASSSATGVDDATATTSATSSRCLESRTSCTARCGAASRHSGGTTDTSAAANGGSGPVGNIAPATAATTDTTVAEISRNHAYRRRAWSRTTPSLRPLRARRRRWAIGAPCSGCIRRVLRGRPTCCS